jgi:hypothetical protein
MRIALLLVLLAACESREKPPAPSKKPAHDVRGTLSLENAPLAISACTVGRGITTFVELATEKGTLRFEDQRLFWSGAELACSRLDRSWGGGQRKDGSHYFRGTLIFVCKGPPGALAGDLTIDCGGTTLAEKADLDANRKKMLDQQAAAGTPQDRCEAVEKREKELFDPERSRAMEEAKKTGLNPSPDGVVKLDDNVTLRVFPKQVVFAACREDKWTLAAQECLINAKDHDAWRACQTAEMMEGIRKRERETAGSGR